MKKRHLLLGLGLMSTVAFAQTATQKAPILANQAVKIRLTQRLDEINEPPVDFTGVEFAHNKRERNTNLKPNLVEEPDPIRQTTQPFRHSKSPDQNWMGQTGGNPPDPTGAAGPNHYFQMINSSYKVYDKTGTQLASGSLGSLLGGGNDGDPIVLYDKFADRWFISQFETGVNNLVVAVSQTNDPLGAYYEYTFSCGSNFPDYPKYSIWSDGYYVTSNKNGAQVYAMERDKMLAGDMNAQFVGFNVPSMATNGFSSPLVAHASATLPSLGTPAYMYYFQDNSWGGVSSDHLKVWEITVDWNNINSSSISSPSSIPVSAFNSTFTWTWDDIAQPGTSQKLDGVPGAMMYMTQYREFDGYNSVVMNHTVDVNGNDQAGIRWYELRQTTGGGAWSLFQEGTYSPDSDSRWLASMCQDKWGNIAMAYAVSSSSTYPSIRYTARLKDDTPGHMTYWEQVAIEGTTSKTNGNRYGDYSHMTIDPDDETFWFTGEYVSGGARTRIFSLKMPDSFLSVENEYMSKTLVVGYLGNNNFRLTMNNWDEEAGIIVTDMNGKELKRVYNVKSFGQLDYTLDLSDLAAGYYIVTLKNENVTKPHKVWVK